MMSNIGMHRRPKRQQVDPANLELLLFKPDILGASLTPAGDANLEDTEADAELPSNSPNKTDDAKTDDPEDDDTKTDEEQPSNSPNIVAPTLKDKILEFLRPERGYWILVTPILSGMAWKDDNSKLEKSVLIASAVIPAWAELRTYFGKLIMGQKLESIGTEVTTINTQVTGLDTKVTSVDTKVGGVDSKVTGVDTKVTGLDTRVTVLDTRVTVLDIKVTKISTHLETETPKVIKNFEKLYKVTKEGFKSTEVGFKRVRKDSKRNGDKLDLILSLMLEMGQIGALPGQDQASSPAALDSTDEESENSDEYFRLPCSSDDHSYDDDAANDTSNEKTGNEVSANLDYDNASKGTGIAGKDSANNDNPSKDIVSEDNANKESPSKDLELGLPAKLSLRGNMV
jgi:hypothetical protein